MDFVPGFPKYTAQPISSINDDNASEAPAPTPGPGPAPGPAPTPKGNYELPSVAELNSFYEKKDTPTEHSSCDKASGYDESSHTGSVSWQLPTEYEVKKKK